MEDVTTTSGAFTKDELSIMGRHPVSESIKQIQSIRSSIDDLVQDTSLTRDHIVFTIRKKFEKMTGIWERLGPSRNLARRMYPLDQDLFDILDKSLVVEHALIDMGKNKPFRKDEKCNNLCCVSVLL